MLRKTLFLTLLVAMTLAACAPALPSNDAAGLTLTDGLGRTVTLASAAQRVVSLAPSNTEILFALGAGDKVVGRDEFSDYPEEAKAIESVGGSMGEYSLEAIVALKPDLVLAAEINTPEQVAALEKLGLTVYYLPNPKSFEELYTNLETVATLTGREATKLTDSLKARVTAVEEKIALLLAASREARTVAGVKKCHGYLRCRREERTLATTDGTLVESSTCAVHAGYQATAIDEHTAKTRAYEAHARNIGYEHIRATPLVAEARRVRCLRFWQATSHEIDQCCLWVHWPSTPERNPCGHSYSTA